MGCGASAQNKAAVVENEKVEAVPEPVKEVAQVESEVTTATPPADSDDEATKQKKEEEAAALKIQANHRGKQGRKEVAAKKAEAAGTTEEATADATEAPKDEPNADNAAEPALTEEEAAKQKAEEEAAALKIQSNHRGKQDRKKVASMKESADAEKAADEIQPETSAPAEGQ